MIKRNAILLIALFCVTLTACHSAHTWQAATCTSPKMCTDCGETDGEALGHTWIDATCESSRFCSHCGLTSGEPLPHTWVEATCTEATHCSLCNKTDGEPLKHIWLPATCTEPERCSLCGTTQGSSLGHSVETWKLSSAATCTSVGYETGACSVCSETCTNELAMIDHTAGDWEVLLQPTAGKEGIRVKYCTSCGKELDTESFTLTKEELKALYKENCHSISYDALSRTPGKYEGEYIKFSGYVVQVCSEASSSLYYSTYRVATSGKYDDVIYIKVDNYGSDSRILEDDYITFYGTFDGLLTYETVLGSSVTIPCMIVEYID